MKAWLTTSCRPVPRVTTRSCPRRTGPDRRTGQPRNTAARTTTTTPGGTATQEPLGGVSTRHRRSRTHRGHTSVGRSRSSRMSRNRRTCLVHHLLHSSHRGASATGSRGRSRTGGSTRSRTRSGRSRRRNSHRRHRRRGGLVRSVLGLGVTVRQVRHSRGRPSLRCRRRRGLRLLVGAVRRSARRSRPTAARTGAARHHSPTRSRHSRRPRTTAPAMG